MNDRNLLILIFVLAILTILHITFYLYQILLRRRTSLALTSHNTNITINTPQKNQENEKQSIDMIVQEKQLEGKNPKKQPLKLENKKTNNNSNQAQSTALVMNNSNPYHTQSDNFQIIEGIGNAIEELLKTAGIKTYKQIAEADYARLKSILISKGNKFAMHDPSTWSKQATLAMNGKWQELDQLKEELIRGQKK